MDAPLTSPSLLEPGARVALATDSGGELSVVVRSVDQRNWSRIAFADGPDGRRYFLKQCVDAGARALARQYEFECQGARLAARVLDGEVRAPILQGTSTELLVLAFEDLALESMDQLLRRDPPAFEGAFVASLGPLQRVLDRLAQPEPELVRGLDVKERPYGTGSTGLCFKGFELRNAGFPRGRGVLDRPRLYLFDFGRPFLAPPCEAAARLFVSIGLLNWGRPLKRFRLGPDERLLSAAAEALGPRLDRAAIEACLERERRMREEVVQARNAWVGAAKSLGMRMLGRSYVERLEAAFDRVLA